jgi:cyanoexosortase A
MISIQLKNPKFWLFGIAVGCITVHLILVWVADNSSLLSVSFLFWAAVSSLVWDKRNELDLESGIFSSFFALSLLLMLLFKAASLSSFGMFLFALPPLLGFCVALLASGFKKLEQYKKELLILIVFCITNLLPKLPFDISNFTAKFAAFVLWYMGSEVVRSGENIYLRTGSVQVYPRCSGIDLIGQMLGIGFLFLLMFSLDVKKRILVPIVAIIVAFVVNGARVALMANLVASNQKEAFKYWHEGDGSLIFSLIAVLCLGVFCWFMLGSGTSNRSNAKT